MRIFNKTQFNDLETANYYGNISISLLSSDEISQLCDSIEKTDYFFY